MDSKLILTTEIILNGIKTIAGDKLLQMDDLEQLIDNAVNHNKIKLLEELSFNAKFSIGLLRVIQKKDSTVEELYFTKAVDEYKASIEKVRALFVELLGDCSDFIRSILTEKYLQLSQISLSNLNSICSDLSYLKLFFNDLKSQSDGNI